MFRLIKIFALLMIIAIPSGAHGFSFFGDKKLDLVKDGVLNFDKSITIGKLFDNYSYFSSRSWESFEDQSGRNIVEFTAMFDIRNITQSIKVNDFHNIDAANGQEYNFGNWCIDNIDSTKFVAQFILDHDLSSFNVGYVEVFGQKGSVKTIENIFYGNDPLIAIGQYIYLLYYDQYREMVNEQWSVEIDRRREEERDEKRQRLEESILEIQNLVGKIFYAPYRRPNFNGVVLFKIVNINFDSMEAMISYYPTVYSYDSGNRWIHEESRSVNMLRDENGYSYGEYDDYVNIIIEDNRMSIKCFGAEFHGYLNELISQVDDNKIEIQIDDRSIIIRDINKDIIFNTSIQQSNYHSISNEEIFEDEEFLKADNLINITWRQIKFSLSTEKYNAILQQQKAWINSGRDKVASTYINSNQYNPVGAYVQATLDRANDLAALISISPESASYEYEDSGVMEVNVDDKSIIVDINTSNDRGNSCDFTDDSMVTEPQGWIHFQGDDQKDSFDDVYILFIKNGALVQMNNVDAWCGMGATINGQYIAR